MDEVVPQAIYFVQRSSEYLTFIGHVLKMAAFGYTLGLDVMFVTENPPDNAPRAFSCPGVWVEYSDRHLESVGNLYCSV